MASIIVLTLALILTKASKSARSSAHSHDSDVDWPVSVNGDKYTYEVLIANNMDSAERLQAVEYAQQEFGSRASLPTPSLGTRSLRKPHRVGWVRN